MNTSTKFSKIFTYLSKAEIVIQLLIWFLSLFYSIAKDVLKKDLLLPQKSAFDDDKCARSNYSFKTGTALQEKDEDVV